MGYKIGKDGSVRLGDNVIVGIGSWTMDGVTTDQVDTSAFGDNWKTFKYGMKDGGTISFNGHADPADVTGQEALREANLYASDLTNLRFYVDNTSYYEPCQTTGYFSPTLTTGAPTKLSTICVTGFNASMDKAGVMAVSFTTKVSGCMVLV
jgi:hypothetical protein